MYEIRPRGCTESVHEDVRNPYMTILALRIFESHPSLHWFPKWPIQWTPQETLQGISQGVPQMTLETTAKSTARGTPQTITKGSPHVSPHGVFRESLGGLFRGVLGGPLGVQWRGSLERTFQVHGGSYLSLDRSMDAALKQ